MLSNEEFVKKQNELDKRMLEIWEHPYFDGITDYEKYKKAPVKILWILKEPNGTAGGNHRDFHKDIRDYKRWKSTYGNIMRVAYAILHKIDDHQAIPDIDTKECTIEDSPVLDEIAIININKSGGNSVTPAGKLNAEYRRDDVKNFLFDQIDFFSPDIIINSHGVYQFFIDQCVGASIQKINGEQYAKCGNRLVLWTSHPNRAPIKSYCNNILRIALG